VIFVVLTRAPRFAVRGTAHRICSDPHPGGTIRTVCGRNLRNTPTRATVALHELVDGLVLCSRCGS